MGIDFAQNIPACGELFALANEACGIDVRKLCEEGPIEELSLTQNTQPALVTTSLVIARALRERGIHIGVVTGSGQATLLRRISEDFKATITPGLIVTANDVRHGKPSPEPYQQGMKKAAALLGLNGIAPSEAVVIENAPLGVRSAVAAGCFTVAVNTGPLPDAALYDEGADVVFGNMHELAEAILP